MNPDADDKSGRNLTPNLPGWILGPVALVFLASAVIYACTTAFSYFAFYDDEGFMMVSVRGVLEGHPLYNEVLTYYGPFYYVYEWVIHQVLALPLTHDVTKGVCVFHWLLAAALLALAAGRMTRATLMSFFVFILAVLHLTPLAREPGHPQELVILLSILAVLVVSTGTKLTWWLLGAVAAALLFTKINAGVLYGLALALTWCCQAIWLQSRRLWFMALLGSFSLVPFLLMRPHLAETWAQVYAGQACAAILAAGMVAYTSGNGRRVGIVEVIQACAAFATVSGLLLGVLLLTGSSLSAMLDNLVLGPSKLGGLFSFGLQVPYCSWSGGVALLAAAAVVAARSHAQELRLVMAAAKGLYGVMGTLFLVSHYNAHLGYLLPWSWLLLVQVPRDSSLGPHTAFTRMFLCFTAIWLGLQAYPTAGTQVMISTFLPVLVCSVCLYDALAAFAVEAWAGERFRNLTPRHLRLAKTFALAGLLYLFAAVWCAPASGWRYYKSVPPLGLRGSNLVRLPDAEAEPYRALTRYLESETDAFITLPGLNSLYFWTGIKPPTYFNASEVILMNEPQQARVVAALQQARHPLIVLDDRGASFVAPAGPLASLIREHCREIKRIGNFRVLDLEKTSLTK